MKLNKIICGDCLEVMKDIPDNSIDLIFTSPPYFDYNDYTEVNPNEYLQNTKNWEEYSNWMKYFSDLCFQKLKDTGFCVINYGDYATTRVEEDYCEEVRVGDFFHLFYSSGFRLIAKRLWVKKREPLSLYITNFGYTAQGRYLTILKAWEYLLFFNKKQRRDKDLFSNSDLQVEDWKEWKKAVWILNEKISKKDKIHHFQFPNELAERVIRMYSNPEDLVCDPFMGSGTTCVVAKKLGRNFIGIDIRKEYCEATEKRIKEAKKSEEISGWDF